MLDNNVLTRIDVAYARNLERLGIEVRQRDVDNALFQKRLEEFDFDMTHYGFSASHSPGNELVDRFTSATADTKGSDNLIGLKSPAVDALVDHVVRAKSRADLVAAARALDRVLVSGHYVIPHYFSPTHRVAYRNTLAMPATLPQHYTAQEWVLTTWWKKP